MKFKDLMLALHKVKEEAEKNGMSQKDIHDLEVVDTGILGGIEKMTLEPQLAQQKGLYCLLIKIKK